MWQSLHINHLESLQNLLGSNLFRILNCFSESRFTIILLGHSSEHLGQKLDILKVQSNE